MDMKYNKQEITLNCTIKCFIENVKSFFSMSVEQKERNIVDENEDNIGKDANIFEAAINGDLERIEFLISNGTDVNVMDPSQENLTPLHFAAQYGHLNVVEFLVNHGARVDIKSDDVIVFTMM